MLKKNGNEYITEGYHPFGSVAPHSFLLFNLESPFSWADRDVHERTFYFAANPNNVGVLEWLTQDQMPIVTLANNHIFNAGYDGFAQTIATLEEAGISYVGLSGDVRREFVALSRSGRLYCFGGYSYDGRTYYDTKTKTSWYVNSLDDARSDIELMMQR